MLRSSSAQLDRRCALLGLAPLYAEKGRTAAPSSASRCPRQDLENPAHHKLYGRILFRRQDFENAAEEFARALRLNPFDRETPRAWGAPSTSASSSSPLCAPRCTPSSS